MENIYLSIEDLMRRMAGLSMEDRGKLITGELGDASNITLPQLQNLARKGKLRTRIFGEEAFFGVGHPFRGDLDRAAASLPHAFEAGMVALYYDANGLFIGPSNPALVDCDPFEGFEFEEPFNG